MRMTINHFLAIKDKKVNIFNLLFNKNKKNETKNSKQ